LEQLEVLFDTNDIKTYQVYKNRIYKLRTLAEKSEIWLNVFAKSIKRKDFESYEISEILTLLNEIDSLFFIGSKIN
jgi:hypothetical protein